MPRVPDGDEAAFVRFGEDIMAPGFTVVPNLVLRYYDRAGMTEGELVFTLEVWQFWWGKDLPYPSVATLAARMGKHPRQVRRYIRDLEQKGLLRIVERFAGAPKIQITNGFDFSPLLARVRDLARAAGDLAIEEEPVQVRERVRTRHPRRGDSSVTPADISVRRGVADLSAEEDTWEEDTGKKGSPQPPASKYSRGRLGTCPVCYSRPHAEDCPHASGRAAHTDTGTRGAV